MSLMMIFQDVQTPLAIQNDSPSRKLNMVSKTSDGSNDMDMVNTVVSEKKRKKKNNYLKFFL